MGLTVRSDPLDRIVRRVEEAQSIVLAGEMGVGKTHLLGEAVVELRRRNWVCTELTANPAAATIPLGALASFAGGGEGVDRLEMLRSTVEALRSAGLGRSHVVTIDDAPLLDDLSIAVLHQFCADHSIPLVATARSTDRETEALHSLWKRISAERFIVDPLDDRSARRLVTAGLRAGRGEIAVDQIVRRSEGNPLFIGELVRAENDGAPGGLTPQLRDMVGARIDRLDDRSRHQLMVVAVSDPFDTDLDIADSTVIEGLERVGLVVTAEEGDFVLARPAHPLFGEVVRNGLTALQRRSVARELTDAMALRPTVRRGDALRLAGWLRACGDEPTADLAVPAALEAIALLDADLANELVKIATAIDPDFAALFAAGEVARLTGDVERALAWFERAFEIAEGAEQIRPVALAIGQLHGFFRNAPDEAVRVLGLAADRLTDPVQRLEVETERAMFGSMLGRYEDVLVSAGRILEHPQCDDGARWTAYTNVSWAEAQLIDLRRIHEHIDEALALIPLIGPERAGEVDLIHAVRVNALMEEGRLSAASAAADELSDGFDGPDGLTAFSASQVELKCGDHVKARRLLDRSIEHLTTFDAFNAYPFVCGAAAICSVVEGAPDRARSEIEQSVARGGDTGMWDQIWLGRARAWLAFLDGDIDRAVSLLLTAADVGIDTTHRGWALLTLHDATAWDRAADVADRLVALRATTRCAPMFELLAESACALAAADLDSTDERIDRLRAMGSAWHAGALSAGAAAVSRRAGDEQRACRYATAARLWMSVTCPQVQDVRSSSLSDRRLAVVETALSGSASREIADTLFLSVRTVDNHLGAAYAALGIKGRPDLVDLFA